MRAGSARPMRPGVDRAGQPVAPDASERAVLERAWTELSDDWRARLGPKRRFRTAIRPDRLRTRYLRAIRLWERYRVMGAERLARGGRPQSVAAKPKRARGGLALVVVVLIVVSAALLLIF